MTYQKAREYICHIGRVAYQRGYVAANDGNISIRVAENAVLLTPTGVSKGYMSPDMLCVTDLQGTLLEGVRQPSSEHAMHLRVYAESPKTTCVVHTHSPAATSFACAGIPLDRPLLTESYVMLGDVPVTQFALPGSEEVPESIAPLVRGHHACLLRNHGVLVWGDTPEQALFRMESIEQYATILMNTEYIIRKTALFTSEERANLDALRKRLGMYR